jgi:large subunit ribosomal protein L10
MVKKSKAFLEKEKIVAEIEKYAREAKSAVFVDYRGITVAEVTALRNKFRKENVVYKIYKNTLVKIALSNIGALAAGAHLTGTLAVAFSMKDEVSAAKIIAEAKFEKKMAFQFGLLGTNVLNASEVEHLATLPSKEVLIAQLLGLIATPARRVGGTIKAVAQSLVTVLDERQKQLA